MRSSGSSISAFWLAIARGLAIDERALARTEFYNDWMRPQRISPHHLGVVLQKDNSRMALLVAPNERALQRDPTKYMRQLELLTPHLSRAIDINQLAARAGFAERTLDDALDVLPAPAYLVEAAGRVLVANALAQSLICEERVTFRGAAAIHRGSGSSAGAGLRP